MSTISDDSKVAEHSGRSIPGSVVTQPPFSNLAVTVEQVSHTMDLGNPVSCWTQQAAWVLMQPSIGLEPALLPEAVQRGALEAVNHEVLPQTMVGTVLQMSMLLEQLISLLSSSGETEELEPLVVRYRHIANENMITIPWQTILEQRGIDHDLQARLDQLLTSSTGQCTLASEGFCH